VPLEREYALPAARTPGVRRHVRGIDRDGLDVVAVLVF
jgi:hypothetical protein